MSQQAQRINLSQKQVQILQVFNDPAIVDILAGGGAGGAKSLTVCLWMAIQCRNYPGICIGLGRKEITRLKQTTLQTLLHEAHKMLGINESEYFYNDQKGLITYINGSSIQLVDLAWMPTDPEYDRFGSLNFTHTVVEELGEVLEKAKNVFTSRKNRKLNNEYHLVGKSIGTCNPSQNFLKREYYMPYKKLGGGEMQKWPHGMVEIDGHKQTAYRCFIRSLVKDNPFISPNYIQVLLQLPSAERKRLHDGDWDFSDDDSMLFKSSVIDKAWVSTLLTGRLSIGVDISDAGSDDTILSLVEGTILTEQKRIAVDKAQPIGEQIALEIIKFAQQHGLTADDAGRIGIDTVGVGASTRDFLRSNGWYIREFVAGASPTVDTFENLRGQTIYNYAQAIDKGEFQIYEKIDTRDELVNQLMAHTYQTKERKIVIEKKETIKKKIGRSPDHAESSYIAFWVSTGDNDSKYNVNRIGF